MTRVLGIIPAGGNASRFNGLYKELLPISNEACGLTRCINSMLLGKAEKIVIATSVTRAWFQKIAVDDNICVEYRLESFNGLWEVIAKIGQEKADRYLFAMPDTVYPMHIFQNMPDKPVVMGEFSTRQPQRFGVLLDGHIYDKHKLPISQSYTAWGLWSWGREAMEFLVDAMSLYKDHSQALDSMLQRFGFVSVYMDYYYDFATFEDYREFLCSTHT